MGLLDSVIGGLMGGGQGQNPILQTVLRSLTGGSQAQGGMGAVLGALLAGGPHQPEQPQQQQSAPGGVGGGLGGALAGLGGLGGLLAQFQQAGLGHVAESWVGSGPNQAISQDQLTQVLGHDKVQDMAKQSGMPANDMLSQLSHMLPSAVDKLTPQGASPFDGAGQNL